MNERRPGEFPGPGERGSLIGGERKVGEEEIRNADLTAKRIICDWLPYARAYSRTPGIATGVKTPYMHLIEGYGKTGFANKDQMTPETPFRVASLTKLFESTAIMQLVDRGRINLSDTVRQYLDWIPQGPEEYKNFTIDELLAHVAGIQRNVPGVDVYEDVSDSRRLEDQVRGKEIVVFPPKEKFKYSNLGFLFLEAIRKKVDGRDWEDYFQQEIAGPLSLTKNTSTHMGEERRKLVKGFEVFTPPEMLRRRNKKRRSVPVEDFHLYAPAFGAVTTVDDMLQFVSSFLPGDDRLLSEEAKEKMLTLFWPAGDKKAETKRALGFNITTNKLGIEIFDHTGSVNGFRVYAGLDLKSKIAVVVFGNASSSPITPISEGIFNTLYHLRERPKDGNGPIDGLDPIPTNVDLSQYTGLYAGTFYNTQIVEGPDHTLYMVDYIEAYYPYDPSTAMAPLGTWENDTFMVGNHPNLGYEPITFYRDSSGKVTSFKVAGTPGKKGVITVEDKKRLLYMLSEKVKKRLRKAP